MVSIHSAANSLERYIPTKDGLARSPQLFYLFNILFNNTILHEKKNLKGKDTAKQLHSLRETPP
jgi:hypothetical protein